MLDLIVAAVLTLLDDRPPAEDLLRFPPPCVCQQAKEANLAAQRFAEARWGFFPQGQWELVQIQCVLGHSYTCWDWLEWSHHQSSPGTVRRGLKELRDLLGGYHYYAGSMPPAAPIWR